MTSEFESRISLEVVGTLPAALDKGLADYLRPYVGNELNDEAIRVLRAEIGVRNVPDYRYLWTSFNYLYYPANFLKSYLCAKYVSPSLLGGDLVILDIGCGGGASAAGFVSGLSEQSIGVRQIVGIDQNDSQLKVFDSVTKPWLADQLGCSARSFRAEMADYCRRIDFIPHVVLVSYALSELDEVEQRVLLDLLNEKFADKGAMVLVVDSDKHGRGIDLQLLDGPKVLVPYSNVIFGSPFLEELDLQHRPKFSESKIGSEVASRYFEAWRKHDICIVRSLFWEDCLYHINVERTLVGMPELISYWLHNAAMQRDVLTKFKILSESSYGVVIEWHASFCRTDTNDYRILDGVMVLELVEGRIKALREFYSQKFVESRA